VYQHTIKLQGAYLKNTLNYKVFIYRYVSDIEKCYDDNKTKTEHSVDKRSETVLSFDNTIDLFVKNINLNYIFNLSRVKVT
jgi:hypothetical protein